MRIHLGHHFYGAGNVGDDFMLAGFLEAARKLAPSFGYSASIPFAVEPLRRRFPQVSWHSYDRELRRRLISESDAWLGLGGSPFQSAQSRWFVDHLLEDASFCDEAGVPMYFLGIGTQTKGDVSTAEARQLISRARAIWTRDAGTAERISGGCGTTPVKTAADLAHLLFQNAPPPPAAPERLTAVLNFDYDVWGGMAAFQNAVESAAFAERIWLVQESRQLPGSERSLFAALEPAQQSRWQVVTPDRLGEGDARPLSDLVQHWPNGEWLVTSRYHSALVGAWAGSKIIVIETNEKLRAAAAEFGTCTIPVDADVAAVQHAFREATPALRPVSQAKKALQACEEFFRAVNSD